MASGAAVMLLNVSCRTISDDAVNNDDRKENRGNFFSGAIPSTADKRLRWPDCKRTFVSPKNKGYKGIIFLCLALAKASSRELAPSFS